MASQDEPLWMQITNFIGISGAIVTGLVLVEKVLDGDKRKNPDKWIQDAIHDPGRVRRYLKRKYGAKHAINEDGTINMQALKDAIQMVTNNPRRDRDNLLNALVLAERLKEDVE